MTCLSNCNIIKLIKKCEEVSILKSVSVFSQKLGRTVEAKAVSSSKSSVMGWMNSGWSKSGGWKYPASK